MEKIHRQERKEPRKDAKRDKGSAKQKLREARALAHLLKRAA